MLWTTTTTPRSLVAIRPSWAGSPRGGRCVTVFPVVAPSVPLRQTAALQSMRSSGAATPRSRSELIHGRRPPLVPVAVDDDEPAVGKAVVRCVEQGRGLLWLLRIHAEQGDLADRGLGERARGRPLEERHAVVEQAETGEALPHAVEVTCEPNGPRSVGSVARELVGDPDPARRHLVGLEKAGHEDRGAASPGSRLNEIALDRLVADHLQTALQVVESKAAQHRRRRTRRRALSILAGCSAPVRRSWRRTRSALAM